MIIFVIILNLFPLVPNLMGLEVKNTFENTASKEKPFKTFTLLGFKMCLHKCARGPSCMAIQYNAQHLICDLLSGEASLLDIVKKKGMLLVDMSSLNKVPRCQSVERQWPSVCIPRKQRGTTTGRCVREGVVSASKTIARRKPTAMSSQHGCSFASSNKGVDGNYDSKFGHKSCFHTDNSGLRPMAWWTVDLLDFYIIEKVVLFNRINEPHRLDKVYVEGYTVDPFFCTQGKVCGFNSGPSGDVVSLTCPNITARFIKLRAATRGWLHVCEVEVFGQLLQDQGCYPLNWETVKRMSGRKMKKDLVDLGSVPSPIECHNLCQRRHLCTVFSYNHVTGACVTTSSPLSFNSMKRDARWNIYHYC